MTQDERLNFINWIFNRIKEDSNQLSKNSQEFERKRQENKAYRQKVIERLKQNGNREKSL